MSSKPTEEARSVRGLIELQRRLCQSKSPFLRHIGTLLAAGVLDKHLSELTDHQVGQLMHDEVGRDLGIVQPESTICHQATQRLFRSTNGSFTEEPPARNERPSCPKCGNEMLLHYGIGKSDFYRCTFLGCEYKEYVGCGEP